MRYHLFQKFFGKIVKIKERSFLSCFVDSLTHTAVPQMKALFSSKCMYFWGWNNFSHEIL